MATSRSTRAGDGRSTGKGANGGISSFEQLIAWQKARTLTQTIYAITSRREFSKDYGLKDQIRRAAVSVMSNIAEGFDRRGLAEFQQFLAIAKGPCAEVKSQLYVAIDVGYITRDGFVDCMAIADETSRIIGALRASVQRKRNSPHQP